MTRGHQDLSFKGTGIYPIYIQQHTADSSESIGCKNLHFCIWPSGLHEACAASSRLLVSRVIFFFWMQRRNQILPCNSTGIYREISFSFVPSALT